MSCIIKSAVTLYQNISQNILTTQKLYYIKYQRYTLIIAVIMQAEKPIFALNTN